jgi:uncharacterized protein YndB with AHSA1/START domain
MGENFMADLGRWHRAGMPILYTLAAALGLFAVYVSTRPAAFRIARSLTIPASPATLHAMIRDLKRWEAWSPWDKIDPKLQRTYEGAAEGVGATYRWLGNKNVGEGHMTITDVEPDARVTLDLEFLKPFPARNVTTFTLTPAGEGTEVTWSMEGNNNFVAKAFGVFMNMDKMVGKDFEKGLAAMRDAAA